jgi:predicted ferric reductase
MNFDLQNENNVLAQRPEQLEIRPEVTAKTWSTNSTIDAKSHCRDEKNKSKGVKSSKPKIKVVPTTTIETDPLTLIPRGSTHHDTQPSLVSKASDLIAVDRSNRDVVPSVVCDDLAFEHHNSEYLICSPTNNTGSISSIIISAFDDSATDPSGGSFALDDSVVGTSSRTRSNNHDIPQVEQEPTKNDTVTAVPKLEATLEDLMSIIEFDDPDFIEDASFHETLNSHVVLSSYSTTPTLHSSINKKFYDSSSEFFPNSSLELIKANARDDFPMSRFDGGSGGRGNTTMTNKPIERVRKMSEVLEVQDEKCTPNRPHPALEYPLLYFFLRRCQWLFDAIKIPYAYRWRLSYPLQQNVPFGTRLQKFGIHSTWGELLLLIPFYISILLCMMYTVVTPSVSMTGKVARYGLISTLVFAQKNSLVTLLLGMPCDRGLFYHKLSGLVACIASALHAVAFFLDPKFQHIYSHDFCRGVITGQVNVTGSVMMLVILAICISAMPRVRRRMYEIFYYLHIVLATGLLVGAFFHAGLVLPIAAAGTWGVDLFIRSIVMARTRYPRKATLKIVSDTVIELTFPKTTAFAYNPGQYVHLAIPEISWLQWHPFSISSSPKQRVVTLHIRKVGNWTTAVFDLCKKQTEVSILLEGPYGNLSVDLMTDRKYKNVMLISGGIGSKCKFIVVNQ